MHRPTFTRQPTYIHTPRTDLHSHVNRPTFTRQPTYIHRVADFTVITGRVIGTRPALTYIHMPCIDLH